MLFFGTHCTILCAQFILGCLLLYTVYTVVTRELRVRVVCFLFRCYSLHLVLGTWCLVLHNIKVKRWKLKIIPDRLMCVLSSFYQLSNWFSEIFHFLNYMCFWYFVFGFALCYSLAACWLLNSLLFVESCLQASNTPYPYVCTSVDK